MPKAKYTDASDKLWAEQFAAAVTQRERKPTGGGWKVFAEIQTMLDATKYQVIKFIDVGRKNGTLETFNGTQIKNGRCWRQVWYRPKPSKA